MPLITSTRSVIVPGTLPVAGTWVKDPLDSSRNVQVYHGEKRQVYGVKRVRGVFTPLGRKKSIVIAGEASYESFVFRALTIGDTSFEKLVNLLDSNRVLQIVMPKRYWYVMVSDDYEVDEDAWSPTEPTARTISVPFVEVDRIS